MSVVVNVSSVTVGNNKTLSNGEDVYIAPETLIASTGGVGIVAAFNSHVLNIFGNIYGEIAGITIGGASDSAFSLLTVASGASVAGHLVGVETTGSLVSITNAGLITGNSGLIHHTGGSFYLVNNGMISSSYNEAVEISSSSGKIINNGTISSQFGQIAVKLSNNESFSNPFILINYGDIISFGYSIDCYGLDKVKISNFGTLSGHVSATNDIDIVVNRGIVNGDIYMNSGNDIFDGRGGEVIGGVYGMYGSDLLRGGVHEDSLDGGDGNDTLWGGAEDDSLMGGNDSDDLYGGNGNDLLDGGNGIDSLHGSLGDDTYVVDNAGDIVFESANGGLDTILSGVSFTLGANLENLVLTAPVDSNGIGNSAANTLTGNALINILNGRTGNDTLTGGGGADSFRFDTTLASNLDLITDFVVGEDKIILENNVFLKLATVGMLSSDFFKSNAGGVAVDANDYILYSTNYKTLYYDADGSGSGAKVQFAIVHNSSLTTPALTAADFLVS